MSLAPSNEEQTRATWLYGLTIAFLAGIILGDRMDLRMRFAPQYSDVLNTIQLAVTIGLALIGFRVSRQLSRIGRDQDRDLSDSEFLKDHLITGFGQIKTSLTSILDNSHSQNPNFKYCEELRASRLVFQTSIFLTNLEHIIDIQFHSSPRNTQGKATVSTQELLSSVLSLMSKELRKAIDSCDTELLRTICWDSINKLDDLLYRISSMPISSFSNKR